MIFSARNFRTTNRWKKTNTLRYIIEPFYARFISLLLIPIVIILLLYSPLTGFAERKPVYLNSQRLEYHVPIKKVFVHGDINMTSERIRIHAEDMELNLGTGEGTATGDVHIYLPQGSSLDTDLAEFNIHTGWWRIQTPDIWLKPSGYLGCEKG